MWKTSTVPMPATPEEVAQMRLNAEKEQRKWAIEVAAQCNAEDVFRLADQIISYVDTGQPDWGIPKRPKAPPEPTPNSVG